jgi:N-acetylneuraminate synthase
MTLDIDEREFHIDDPKSLWHGRSLYELYEAAHTPWEWHEHLFKRAAELGIVCFATAFDVSSVEFLEGLENPIYKIASFENTDLPLIRKVAATGKPMMISTGMATVAELDETVRTAREAGCNELLLLKCTSSYPATPDNANILTIPHLRNLFHVQVGLSDHTLGIGVALASVALGATLIEKHFTISRADGGVDAAFSLEPDELKALVIESERAWQALGEVSYGLTDKERASIQFRRSLYIVADMKAGEKFSEHNLRAIRPGLGLPPKYFDVFLGKTAATDISHGTPASWELLA